LKLILSRFFILCLFSACLFADDIHWGGTWSGIWSGFETSPYTAINRTQGNNVLAVFCLDYNDEIAPPYDWQANILPVTQSNVSNYAQYGSFGTAAKPWAFNGDLGVDAGHSVDLSASILPYNRYLEAAWLFTNIMAAQSHDDLNTMIVSQVAAWTLFVNNGNLADLTGRIQNTNDNPRATFSNYAYSTDNYATAPTTFLISDLLFQDAVNEALKAAQNAVLNQNWYGSAFAPHWELVTSDPVWSASYGRPAQEFLTDPPPPVPEPASALLLGTGMLGMVLTVRRKKRVA
jgi:PEP-CTERM motif